MRLTSSESSNVNRRNCSSNRTFPPCVATLEGRVLTTIRSRCAPGLTRNSLAPSVESAHVALSESVAAARVAISTATRAGSPLDASESAFQAARQPDNQCLSPLNPARQNANISGGRIDNPPRLDTALPMQRQLTAQNIESPLPPRAA